MQWQVCSKLPSFNLYPLPYFFLFANAYSGFSIFITPEHFQSKPSCGGFVYISRETFLYSDKECGEIENLILLLYDERSHYKEHPSCFPFLLLIPSSNHVPSNPFDKVALNHLVYHLIARNAYARHVYERNSFSKLRQLLHCLLSRFRNHQKSTVRITVRVCQGSFAFNVNRL